MISEMDLRKSIADVLPDLGGTNIFELAKHLRKLFNFVEVETFSDPGGWEIDTQFVETMGSPYLLAHGMGRPVADARTRMVFSRPGTYRVYARTRDWVVYPSDYQPAPGGIRPGAFQIIVDGKILPEILGANNNGAWNWQIAGRVEIGSGSVELALHDLVGFDARCDALLFVSTDVGDFSPPDSGPELEALRGALLGWEKGPEDVGEFDLVVVGGGFAGASAAITGARHGMRVAIIQDRPIYGGPGSSEVRVNPIRHLRKPPFPRNGDVMVEMAAHKPARAYTDLSDADEARDTLIENTPNLSAYTFTIVVSVEMSGDQISAVIAHDVKTGKRLRFKGHLFADCSGDSIVGFKAGAEYRQGREGRAEFNEPFAPLEPDEILLGNSLYWWAAENLEESEFPETPWALSIENENQYEVPVPKWPQPPKEGVAYAGGWNWETGFYLDNVVYGEQIRDHLFRAIYGTWFFIKNQGDRREYWEKTHLEWMGFITGKRESKRIMGDFLLNQNHIMDHQVEPDGVATATWYFDLHFPHPVNTKYWGKEAFRSVAFDDPQWETKWSHVAPGWYQEIKPYPIPYRCLYSKDVSNLFMAGRNISVTHAGLAPVRTMMCTAQMGTVVGRAASLCQRNESMPREIYEEHLDSLLDLLADPKLPPVNSKKEKQAKKHDDAWS
jgi:hypothetical protein